MNGSQFSQKKKAVAARKWRATNTLKKRFDGPLKEFIKIKYVNIFNEYSEFYQHLDKENPNVRDLSKTRTFRNWIKNVRKQQESQQARGSDQEESQQARGSDQEESQQARGSDQGELSTQVQDHPSHQVQDEPAHLQESRPNILSLAINEIMPEGIPEQVSASLNEHLPEVTHQHDETLFRENLDQIINELKQEQAVRDILDPVVDEIIERYNVEVTTDNDEGIELNFMDELDLQPFDYNLEVDF